MLSFLFSTTSLNYLYTATNYVGTFRHDIVFSSFRNDTINTGAGNDWVDSGAGNDLINLGAGDDVAYAGSGNDTVDGGTGNDWIDGGNGNDVLRGGGGNDWLFGGQGNDNIVYRAEAGSGLDRVNGGQGFDTLTLEVTAAQQASAGFIADRAAFNAYLAGGGNGGFTFQSIGLIVTGGFESLNIVTIGGPGPVNTAPVVSGAVALPGGVEDTTTTITAAQLLANATDAEGNALSVVNLQASSGTLVNNGNGTWSYTPAANANGPVSFSYSVSDGSLSTAATATLAVAAVNDGPVAGAAVVLPALAEDTSVTITAAQLLANASDIDSATLSVVNLQASNGTLVDNGNGTWSFIPDLNDDTSVSFTYQISDGDAAVAGSASLDLTAVNDAPEAGAPVVIDAIPEDNGLDFSASVFLANASDIDGDALNISNLVASSGSLVLNEDGTYSYTPAENDDTEVTFTYDITDGDLSVSSSATMDLTPVNDLPIIGPNSWLDISVSSAFAGAGQLYATDVETAASELTFELYTEGDVQALGFVIVDSDGQYLYLPPGDITEEGVPFESLDQFQVKITDADGGFTIETVNVNVVPEAEFTNYVDANNNRGALVGTTFVADQFYFYNSNVFEISTGIDFLENFTSGEDVIFLDGDYFAVTDIISNAVFDGASERYIYNINAFGASISSSVALVESDFNYILAPS